MSNRFRNTIIKLVIFTTVAVLITFSVIDSLLDSKTPIPFLPIGGGNSYHALFTNATGLQSGDLVRIAGVEVGKVNGVSLCTWREGQPLCVNGKPDCKKKTPSQCAEVKVDFSVETRNHLTTNSTAQIQFENLLGQRYLEIKQGPPGGQALGGGSTILVNNTTEGLDLTSVFNGVQPLLTALNPDQINQLTSSIIAILQGESGAVSNLVTQIGNVTHNLVDKYSVVDVILNNLTPLLQTANNRSQQINQVINGLSTLAKSAAGQSGTIGNAISGLDALTHNATQLLAGVQPNLDRDLQGLNSTTNELLNNQTGLTNLIGNLPTLLNALNKVASSGSYLAIYVCDLSLHTATPGVSPADPTYGALSVRLLPTVPQSPPVIVPQGFIGDPTAHTPVCA